MSWDVSRVWYLVQTKWRPSFENLLHLFEHFLSFLVVYMLNVIFRQQLSKVIIWYFGISPVSAMLKWFLWNYDESQSVTLSSAVSKVTTRLQEYRASVDKTYWPMVWDWLGTSRKPVQAVCNQIQSQLVFCACLKFDQQPLMKRPYHEFLQPLHVCQFFSCRGIKPRLQALWDKG